MDSVITQGKELGIYFYMLTGGEPLVRKKDVIALCKKHNDCIFLAYTNGTLVDEELCRQMQEAGNLFLALSLEGKPEVNDLRRGEGVYGKVMHAMELLKENGLVFGTSICYTSQNIESVTSDEFIQMSGKRLPVFSVFPLYAGWKRGFTGTASHSGAENIYAPQSQGNPQYGTWAGTFYHGLPE